MLFANSAENGVSSVCMIRLVPARSCPPASTLYTTAHKLALRFDNAQKLTHRYLYGPATDQALVDEVFSATGQSQEVLWQLADHQGTIRDIADDNGTLRKHVDYDSFGLVKGELYYDQSGTEISSGHSAAVDQLFYFQGQEFDKATGLQNNNARWFDPRIGRFLSEDPSGFGGGDANLYRYVGNSPLNYTDPTGLYQAGNPLGKLFAEGFSLTRPQLPNFQGDFELASKLAWQNFRSSPTPSDILRSQFQAAEAAQIETYSASTRRQSQVASPAPVGSLRSRLNSSIDNWANGTRTGWTIIDAPAAALGSAAGNLLARPVVFVGTHWRNDTYEERIATIHARQRLLGQENLGTGKALVNLYANATTDQIAFGAVGYDPYREEFLSFSESGQRIAGGTAGYAASWMPVAAPLSAMRAGTTGTTSGVVVRSTGPYGTGVIDVGLPPSSFATMTTTASGPAPIFTASTGTPFALVNSFAPSTGSTGLRPGSVSGNPGNRLMETGIPLKNQDGWVKRWTRATADDEAAQNQAIFERYQHVQAESRNLPFDQQHQYRFEQMRQFRTDYRQQFLRDRD